jgi:hypothetical protein
MTAKVFAPAAKTVTVNDKNIKAAIIDFIGWF